MNFYIIRLKIIKCIKQWKRAKKLKNKLEDLNNHLFETIERLNDENIVDEKLQEEITRAKAISDIAGKIIENGNLALKAIHEQNEYGISQGNFSKILIGSTEE